MRISDGLSEVGVGVGDGSQDWDSLRWIDGGVFGYNVEHWNGDAFGVKPTESEAYFWQVLIQAAAAQRSGLNCRQKCRAFDYEQ